MKQAHKLIVHSARMIFKKRRKGGKWKRREEGKGVERKGGESRKGRGREGEGERKRRERKGREGGV